MAVFGDTLRQARAHLGVTLKEAEFKTRIPRHYLLALEEERFDDLPALVFQRGFVRNYSTYLRLDPNKLLSMFEEARGGAPDDAPLVTVTPSVEIPSRWVPNFAFLAFLVVMSAVVFAWMYSAYFAPGGETATPNELIPTVTAVSEDSYVLPSPTATAPKPTATATVQPTVEPTSTSVATQVADQPTIATDDAATESTTDESDVTNFVTPDSEPTTASTGSLSLDFTATSDIETLKIVGNDGSVLWDDALPAGESTGFISADTFDVYVSDPTALEISKEGEDPFTMGDNTFHLP